jgi:putative membrane protein
MRAVFRAMLPRLIFAWLANVVALFVAAWIISSVDYGDDFWVLFIAALVFTVVNIFVRPLVILLALPVVVLTLGLALILINVLMLYLTDWIVPSFETGSFWATLGAAVIVSIVNLILNLVLKPDERLRDQPV